MEHTTRAAVVPVDMGWSDLGSWDALWEMGDKDAGGNALIGNVVAEDARNCYLRSEAGLVAAIGVEDLVVVATDDAVMVAPRNRAQDVRRLVARLRRARAATRPTRCRPCTARGAAIPALHNGHRVQVKHIIVKPGGKLSLQMHHHRAEHWVVVQGTAQDRPRRRGDHPDRGPVDLHPARHAAPARKPRQDPAARDRGAIRRLSRRRRHRPLRRPLRTGLKDAASGGKPSADVVP